jgi:hypothetical protein
MSQPSSQPPRIPVHKPLTIKDLSKKLEISSIDFTEAVKTASLADGKVPLNIFDTFANKIHFLEDKITMRMRAFDPRISDVERKLHSNCKEQIEKHKSKLVALFAENLNQRAKEIKHAPIDCDAAVWKDTIKYIREIYTISQQIAKRGGFINQPRYIEAFKKFEQQVIKTILSRCTFIISQKENVNENLTEQYTLINALPMSNQAREDLKDEINKGYRKVFNENFKLN